MVMGSHRPLLLLTYILLHVVGLTIAQPELLAHYCLETGNYTSNSTYQTNLNTVLSSLSSNTNTPSGFYNFSVGQNTNKVNALALCRGDVELDNCRTCLSDSSDKLKQLCPNEKEAIGWSDNCMLRYSNRSIFRTMEFLPNAYLYNIKNSTVVQFNSVVRNLLESLRGKAARGGSILKFATGNMSGTDNLMVYGLVQCTPDLSEHQCNDCLNMTFGLLPSCCDGKIGGRVLTPSCHFRYEIGRFYNETLVSGPQPPPAYAPPPDAPRITFAPPPANAPPSPSGKGGRTKVGPITLSTIMAAVTAILFL